MATPLDVPTMAHAIASEPGSLNSGSLAVIFLLAVLLAPALGELCERVADRLDGIDRRLGR